MRKPANLPQFGRDRAFPEESLGDYLPIAANQRRPEPSRSPPPAAFAAFAGALDRLEEIIDQETSTLEAHKPTDLPDFNRRKSCSLLELMRITRALPAAGDVGLRARLQRLRKKLERNQSVLKLHLDAVREIGDLLVGALGEADSDGTYGMPLRRRETAR
jgi:hypothetical protein